MLSSTKEYIVRTILRHIMIFFWFNLLVIPVALCTMNPNYVFFVMLGMDALYILIYNEIRYSKKRKEIFKFK